MRNADIELRRLQREADAASDTDAPMAHYLLGAERSRRGLCPRCGTPGVEVVIPPLAPSMVKARDERLFRLVARLSATNGISRRAMSAAGQERVAVATVRVSQALRPSATVLGCPACRWNGTHGWCDPSKVTTGAVGVFQSQAKTRRRGHIDVMVMLLLGREDAEGTQARVWPVAWVQHDGWAFPELVDSAGMANGIQRFANGVWRNVDLTQDPPHNTNDLAPTFVPTYLVPDSITSMPHAIAHEEQESA